MSSSSTYSSLLHSMNWLHAVNTEQLWHEQIKIHNNDNDIPDPDPLGIEVDVRYSEVQDEPVLAHDRITIEKEKEVATTTTSVRNNRNNNDANHQNALVVVNKLPPKLSKLVDFLKTIAASFATKQQHPSSSSSNTQQQKLVVLKLDIKGFNAAHFIVHSLELQQQLIELKSKFIGSGIILQIWFNVDVLPITPSQLVVESINRDLDVAGRGDEDSSSSSSRLVTLLKEASSTNLFDVFSLGWIGCGRDDVVSYNKYCCEKMLGLLKESGLVSSSFSSCAPFRISFAVRSSFVKTDPEARRHLRTLMEKVKGSLIIGNNNEDSSSSLQEPTCFLTFWRGRKEKIEEEDIDVAEKYFKNEFTMDMS